MHQETDLPLKHEPLSLRQRLILALLTPLIIILTVSSYFDYQLATKTANNAHDQALADNVFDLEAHIQHQNPSFKLDLTEETEAMLRSDTPDMLYFSVTDPSGKVLAGDADLPPRPPPKGSQVEFSNGYYHDAAVRIAVHRIGINAQDFLITVMETTNKRDRASSRILTAMVIPNLAVVLATMLAVTFGVRQGLLPLEEVERDIAARSANDLHEIELSGNPAEIRPMLRRLNELFALLRESVEVQQRFIADAAHQLRTPLAGLQAQLDLATTEGAFSNNPERLQLIDEATTRIGHMLTQLLAYARAETSNPVKDKLEEVRLEKLVENSASIFLDCALAKNIDLGFDIKPATTSGFPWMLQEALSNLIDNAIRYTPTGGVITVSCGEEQKRAFLEVEDSGPGIADEHLKHVFERFYRIPGSPGNGCGLGLPIVSEIAQLHGATIQLARSEQGGLRVRIQFTQHSV
jgi:two-component system, OmpR family, sensor histidine kinase TctE